MNIGLIKRVEDPSLRQRTGIPRDEIQMFNLVFEPKDKEVVLNLLYNYVEIFVCSSESSNHLRETHLSSSKTF